MASEFDSVNLKTSHLIYLDNNVFRRLRKYPEFWENFFIIFNKDYPHIFDCVEFIFTWCQLVEDAQLGRVLSEVDKSPLWKEKIIEKKIFERLPIAEALDLYFEVVQNIIATLSSLQKDLLLREINKSINKSCQETKVLVQETLIKAKVMIEQDDYMDSLSFELAWAFITSHLFIKSPSQWESRKEYLDSLMALLHRLTLEKHELNFYRLAETRYYSYVQYSRNVTPETSKNVLRKEPLKELGDLCDGELIHYALLGSTLSNTKVLHRVVCVTMDSFEIVSYRKEILQQSMIDLKRQVDGWSIDLNPGEVFCVVSDQGEREKIIKIDRVTID